MSTDLPWTIGRLLEWTTQFLQQKGATEARLEAQLLLAHALGCSRTSLYTRFNEEPPEAQRTRFRELVQRRVKGEPVAHLLGTKDFFSLEFEVNRDVLVPRKDSEWLVTECLALTKPLPAPRILDVGTGSGCLAIALAKHHPGAQVTAIDISEAALTVAQRNATKHKLSERVRFVQGDLFTALDASERFDAIVSNPPYIPTAVLATLAPEVRDHEPHLALDGGEGGFRIIDGLLKEGGAYLEQNGSLLIEIGFDQEAEAKQRFAQQGWSVEKVIQDNEGHARVIRARRV